MSRFGNSLMTLLLSVLMVSASVSGSACDLSCSLREAHSFCDATKMVTPNNDGASMARSSDMDMHPGKSAHMMGPHMDADSPSHTMPMSSSMDMGPDRSSMINSEPNLISSPEHSMPMRMQFESKTEEFVRSASDGCGSGIVIDHSGNSSPCMREPCSLASFPNSPPKVNDARHIRLSWMSAHPASPLNASGNFHWTRPGSAPIKTIAVDRLTTTLRI
jgi:hypothetical protein